MKKFGSAIVSISLWLVTATALLMCVLLGRLFFAPIDVGFARDQIISQSNALLPGWNVKFKTAKVGWDWSDVRPWVMIEDVRLIDRRNRLTASLPRAEIGLGFEGILSGLGISTVEIGRADIRITDLGGFSDTTDDSLFKDLFGESGIPRPEIFIPLTEAFNRFTLRLLATAPSLDRIAFDSLSVRLYRGDNLSEGRLSVSTFVLEQDGSELDLSAQLEASVGGNPINTQLLGRANPNRGDLSLLVSLKDFHPSSFPVEAGLPKQLKYFQLPIDVSLSLDLDAGAGLRSANIEATLGEGEIYDPAVFPTPAPVTFGSVTGIYNPREKILVFDQIDLTLEDNHVGGNGLLYWHQTSDTPGVQLELKTTDLSVMDALDYWPITRHPDGRERGARAWIDQHMVTGNTKNLIFRVDAAPSGVGTYLNESIYELGFDFDGLNTKFMQTMPPIIGASGSATLTRTGMTISVAGGQLLGMSIGGSQAKLSNIHIRDGGIGEFSIFARGGVKTIMQLIDNPPLLVAQKAKLDIDRLDGTATVKALVRSPLIKNPPRGSTSYDVSAELSNTSVKDLLGGEGLTGAQLSLRVSQDSLSAAGNGLLNGVPVALRWEEDFAAGRDDPTVDTTLVVLRGDMDGNDIKALGVDVENFLDGKAHAEASFQGRNFKFSHGTFTADASTAQLKLPQLGWVKPVGAPATINGGVIFTEKGTTVAPLRVQGEGVNLVASIDFGPKDSGIFDAEIQVRRVGENQLIATLDQKSDQPLAINVQAETFDLSPFLRPDTDAVRAEDHGVLIAADKPATDFDLSLSANRILLENAQQWDDAALELKFRGGQPTSLSLEAVVGGAKTPITISVLDELNAADGTRPFSVRTDDGGQLLRGMGFFAHVDGGALTLDARTRGWGNRWHLDGRMNVTDAMLVPKATLGEGITRGEISGVDDYLEGKPLQLDVLEVPFEYDGRIIEFSGIKANGPTVGLTMEGEIATIDGLINVNGVVVPAYGINSLLGNIPLVGGLFSGGDGKGLFGVAYRVKGTTEHPDVSVNALSGLAPGFLRLLFEGRKGRVADVKAPDATKTPDDKGDPLDPNGDAGG